MHALQRLETALAKARQDLDLVRVSGAIAEANPAFMRVVGLSRHLKLGDRVRFGRRQDDTTMGEVVRIERSGATVKPFGTRIDLGIGTPAFRAKAFALSPDPSWKGRVVDALGRPIDDEGPLREGAAIVPVDREPPPAMSRAPVRRPVKTGVHAIDLFAPICAGQRIGIFAGSGVGKSTLLAMMARAKGFDTVVVALVGERGREVREFLADALGANRARAVTVVSTGDESAMMRRLAPRTAMAIAESFRDRGESVLLIVDSVTRFAHAARDVALAAGEPAVARGYPPSVFTDLPKLFERAGPGPGGHGAITGLFSVLVDGDDHNDPVADTLRGTLDGHIVLDRGIAEQGRFPAVNVLTSISRLAQHVWTSEERVLVGKLKGLVARFEDTADLRLMGGYQAGSDAMLDQAVALVPKIYEALVQHPTDAPSEDVFRELATALQG